MKPVASYVTRFFRWWGGSLMSCLPASTARYISDVHNRIDLVIAHQGESIFIQTSRGRILESIALTQEIGIDFSNLPDANTDVRLEATGASFDADRFELTRDPEMSRQKGQFVAALKEDIQQIDIDLLDLAISREDRPVDDATCDIDLSAPMDNTNVIPIDVHRDDNTVRLVEDDDETAHLLDPEQQVEDDTFIIQRDQGKLLQFGTTVAKAPDHTVLFCSVNGRIQQVEPHENEIADVQNQADAGEFEDMPQAAEQNTPLAFMAVAKMLEKYRGNKRCLYMLPEKDLFLLRLSYPIEAMENIESVLRYDLEKHIPISVREVRFFYALGMDSTSNKVNVEVAVIKARDFDLLNQILGRFAGNRLVCTTERFYRKFGNTINFLDQNVAGSWRNLFSLRKMHLALNLVLLAALIAMPLVMLEQKAQSLDSGSADEIRRVGELVASVNALNAESRFGSRLTARISDNPKIVKMLSVLSGSINDRAWLDRLNYKDGEIKIKGQADSATAVSDEIGQTGLFEQIKFISSIVKDPASGKETFELVARLKSDG